jgi:hypothetical protein
MPRHAFNRRKLSLALPIIAVALPFFLIGATASFVYNAIGCGWYAWNTFLDWLEQ